MTDEGRIDFLEHLAKKSPTGLSIDYHEGGYRFMFRHNVLPPRPTVREAIDQGAATLETLEKKP